MRYYDGYSYGATVSTGDTVGITILLIYLIILLVWGLAALIGYILKGIGMYTIAKRRGMDYPWLAYVPFARAYLRRGISRRNRIKRRKNTKIRESGCWHCRLSMEQYFYLLHYLMGGWNRRDDLVNE